MIEYRDYIIEKAYWGYSFAHKDFDGAPNEIWETAPFDGRWGNAESVEDAKVQIDEMIAELGEE